MQRLFSTGQIGRLTLHNRLVMTPMHLGYCPSGEVTAQLIEFYRLRARGGVGMIIVGGCGIDQIGNMTDMIQLDDDRYIPGLQNLTDAIHSEGASVIAQLYQSGRYASSRITGHVPVAPSPIPSKLTGEIPHALNEEEIQSLVSSYAQAARRAKEAGFDGVEILTGTGYLISQFLSPLTNQRTDRYGGDLTARMTFALEVIHTIRQVVGPDFAIMARIAGNDFMPNSHTHAEAKEVARAFAKAGIDALNVTGGWHETVVPQITMNVPQGTYTYLARGIKESVSIPVIACNRISTPSLAEEILARGDADFIGMARPFIADPDFACKAKRGKAETIRPCMACNQGCLDQIFRHHPVTCLVNAQAGHEAELLLSGHLLGSKPAEHHHILVIGAGPAGLEFARVARLRGHHVTIWEEKDQSGGQLHLAAIPPGRKDFLRFVRYLHQACLDLEVGFVYRKRATAAQVLEAVITEGYTHIVLATGAEPLLPPLSIEDGAHVVQAWDVLSSQVETGQNIVIIGGGAVGIETAMHLAKIGTLSDEMLRFLFFHRAESEQELRRLLTQGVKHVTLIEMSKGFGRDLGPSTRWSMLSDLKQYHVHLLDRTKALAIQKNAVLVDFEEQQDLLAADTVVFAAGSRPNKLLYEELIGKVRNLTLIGDALQPAKADAAIQSAYYTATNI